MRVISFRSLDAMLDPSKEKKVRNSDYKTRLKTMSHLCRVVLHNSELFFLLIENMRN